MIKAISPDSNNDFLAVLVDRLTCDGIKYALARRSLIVMRFHEGSLDFDSSSRNQPDSFAFRKKIVLQLSYGGGVILPKLLGELFCMLDVFRVGSALVYPSKQSEKAVGV